MSAAVISPLPRPSDSRGTAQKVVKLSSLFETETQQTAPKSRNNDQCTVKIKYNSAYVLLPNEEFVTITRGVNVQPTQQDLDLAVSLHAPSAWAAIISVVGLYPVNPSICTKRREVHLGELGEVHLHLPSVFEQKLQAPSSRAQYMLTL